MTNKFIYIYDELMLSNIASIEARVAHPDVSLALIGNNDYRKAFIDMMNDDECKSIVISAGRTGKTGLIMKEIIENEFNEVNSQIYFGDPDMRNYPPVKKQNKPRHNYPHWYKGFR